MEKNAVRSRQIHRRLAISSNPTIVATTSPATNNRVTNTVAKPNTTTTVAHESLPGVDTANEDVGNGTAPTIGTNTASAESTNNVTETADVRDDLVDDCASDEEDGEDGEDGIRSREKSDIWHEYDGVSKLL